VSLPASPEPGSRPDSLAPIDSDARLHSLDILRGLALAGMILVHFHQRLERPVAGVEDWIGYAVWILVENKAWGTFAFLFGVGFALLLRRLEARRAPIVRVYLRRLAGLAVIGVATQVLFGFHVLFEYACWGLVLLLIRRWSTGTLLVVAVLAACARPIVAEATALYAWWAATPPAPPGPNLWAGAEAATKLASYGEAVAARWALFLATLPHQWRDFLPGSNLTLFILGLLAVRHRVLDEPMRHVRLIVGWMTFGAIAWTLSWTLMRVLPEIPEPGADWPVKVVFGLVQDQWLTFTYVGAVVLLLQSRPWWIARLRAVGQVGRMALTNYVAQAALFDLIGSRFGLGLRVRPYAYLLLTPLMVAGLAATSSAWLARHRFGPLEWLWRCVTYARFEPLRREPDASLGVTRSAI